MDTKEMADKHNEEVRYCYDELSKALDLMYFVQKDNVYINEVIDILENISLSTFIEVNKND